MGVAYYMEQVISFKTADLIQTGRREKTSWRNKWGSQTSNHTGMTQTSVYLKTADPSSTVNDCIVHYAACRDTDF